MQETGKTRVVAAFLVIGGIFMLLAGLFYAWLLIVPLIFSGGVAPAEEPLGQYLLFGILGLALGIFDFVVSNALHKLKKWAYIVAFAQFGLAGVGNLVFLITGSRLVVIPLIGSVVLLILLYLDKDTFFGQSSITTNL